MTEAVTTPPEHAHGAEPDAGRTAAPATPIPRPPWLGRAVLLFFVGLGTFIVVGWMLLQLRSMLTLILVSLVASFALEPAVNRLERLGVRRSAGTLLTFLIVLLLGAGFIFLMGRLIAEQVTELIEQGPAYITSTQDWINRTFEANLEFDDLIAEFNAGGRLGNLATQLAPNILSVGAQLVSLLFELLTVALFTFYLVADGPRLRRTVCSIFPPTQQREILHVWELGIVKTGGYIYSRAVLALASAVFHWVAFQIIGVPSPLVLAIWVGFVSQFVPVVGTYIAGFVPLAIAVAARPVDGLWVLAVVAVYQQIENYLLAPRVTAHTMDIHPAVAFGSVIAGAALLGPVGALLALPLAATGTALGSSLIGRHEVVESRLTRPPRRSRLWRRQRTHRVDTDGDAVADVEVTVTTEVAETPLDRAGARPEETDVPAPESDTALSDTETSLPPPGSDTASDGDPAVDDDAERPEGDRRS